MTRRRVLMAAAGMGISGMMLRMGIRPARSLARPPLVWVWQFSIDDEPAAIAQRLSALGLGILLKTHDGLNWMSRFDTSPEAVDGPGQVSELASYFEARGVPFHAWCVATGENPVAEAEMAAAVLKAGARSLYLDIEPHAGFWQGTANDAAIYASTLRSLRPADEIVLSIDPRPWMLPDTPMDEITPYVNSLAPQSYWTNFNTSGNRERFEKAGLTVPPGGPTPEFLINMANLYLGKYGLPILHIGPGDSESPADWQRFISSAGNEVSLWRYGITNNAILSTLAGGAPVAVDSQPVASSSAYVVEQGDSLSAIADRYGVTTAELKEMNGIEDEDFIVEGQVLQFPSTAMQVTHDNGHIVQPGDTLTSIAIAYDTTIDDLRDLNRLQDPDSLMPGQHLRLMH